MESIKDIVWSRRNDPLVCEISMSDFRIEFEWQDPGAAKGPELRATWACLKILADGKCLTRLEDLVSNSNRDSLYAPLYPIAEWFASNWWSLFHEIPSPGVESKKEYHRRHNILAAAEGFALPWLSIEPEGARTVLHWRPRDLPTCRVRFLNEGRAVIETSLLKERIRAFIRSVLTRLENECVVAPFLAEEWEAIESADHEEASFCKAAARMGLDPYSIGEGVAQTIVDLGERLPSGVFDEYLYVADLELLRDQGVRLSSILSEAGELDLDLQPLKSLREECLRFVGGAGTQLHPWQEGYEFARRLRNSLVRRSCNRLSSLEEVRSLFEIDPLIWERAVVDRFDRSSPIDAAVASTKTQSPYFAIQKRESETGNVFKLCRALFEYLSDPEPSAAIITRSRSERQKRNRAFAAEFIAPEDRLRDMIGTAWIAEEDIQEIAQNLGASEFVIRHQIINHGIANIIE